MANRPTDKDKTTNINTGGGGYFGGNVTAGGDVVGRDKVTVNRNIETNQQGVSLEEFRLLLADLQQQLSQAKLEPETARIIEGDVKIVDEQAGKETANGNLIKNRLQSIKDLLAGAGNMAGSIDKIMSTVNKAMQLANTLFP